MCWLCNFFGSSIGKKVVMGLTGLLLCGFLLSHLTGNTLMLVSARSFNVYAHTLISNPLIYIAEIILLLIFFTHIITAIKLLIENRNARPEKYFMKVHTGRGATFASASMPYTGFIVLLFLGIHLYHLKYGVHYTITYDGEEMRNLYKLFLETFQSNTYLAWYTFAQIALGIHVYHGFSSAFQSLGFNHLKYSGILKKIATVYAVIITLGLALLPIWAHFKGGL